MINNKTAFWFHHEVCRSCHAVPKSAEWIAEQETNGLNIFTVTKRQDKQKIWEPFFLCTQKEPLWDERLNWEGQGNKMCEVSGNYIISNKRDWNFLKICKFINTEWNKILETPRNENSELYRTRLFWVTQMPHLKFSLLLNY